jgi:hypothetical protein
MTDITKDRMLTLAAFLEDVVFESEFTLACWWDGTKGDVFGNLAFRGREGFEMGFCEVEGFFPKYLGVGAWDAVQHYLDIDWLTCRKLFHFMGYTEGYNTTRLEVAKKLREFVSNENVS